MKGYHMVDHRPCLLEESGDPFTIPTPPHTSYDLSITHTTEPSLFPWWSIIGIIIGLLAIVVGMVEVFRGRLMDWTVLHCVLSMIYLA